MNEPANVEYAREDLVSAELPLWRRSRDWRRPSFAGAVGILILLTLTLIVLAVFVLPERMVKAPSDVELAPLQPVERLQAENAAITAQNAVRTTLIQAIGGGLFFVTAFVAWQQVRTARQGQATDRFTKSIEQIGDDKTDVRLGGIYALRQMSDIQAFRQPVAEILAAYLRTHSARRNGGPEGDAFPAASSSFEGVSNTGKQPLQGSRRGRPNHPDLARRRWAESRQRPRQSPTLEAQNSHQPDKQAVLRILIHDGLWRRAEVGFLDLSFVELRGADLREADLRNSLMRSIDISYGDLRGAVLEQVDIRDAQFLLANMTNCSMRNALLEGAHFSGANLSLSNMSHVQASNADFRGSRLTRADLTNADLTGADLRGAILNGAVLTGATLLNAKLDGASFFDVVDMNGAQFDGRSHFETVEADADTRKRLLRLVP